MNMKICCVLYPHIHRVFHSFTQYEERGSESCTILILYQLCEPRELSSSDSREKHLQHDNALDANIDSILGCAGMKKLSGVGALRFLFVISIVIVSAATCAAYPTTTNADSINTQTQQLIPPGMNTCAAVTATNFTPYIYADQLDSFEFTVPDASYVALVGSVGNTPVGFQLMTRRVDPATGVVRIHVDVDPIRLTGTLPIQITLLSAKTGQPTCAAIVNATVGTGPIMTTPTTPPTTPPTGGTSGGAGGANSGSNTGSTSGGASTTGGAGKPAATSSTSTKPTTTATTTASTSAGVSNPFASMCSSQSGAYRLWLVLVVLYALLVGALIWAEWPESWAWVRRHEWVAAGILVPLAVLLLFWYFAVNCRGSWLMPAVLILIALAGLVARFWDHPYVKRILLIEEK